MGDDCIFEGRFGEIHIPDVLTFLDMLGKTGTLEVRSGDVIRHLYWDTGEIVFADSSRADESLPGHLCANGHVSPEAVEEARSDAEDEAGIVGALIRMGELEPALLPKALRSLVLDIVYVLFGLEEGTFRFAVTERPHDEKVVLRTSVSNIIMEGSRRLDEWRRIRTVFPSDQVYPLATEAEPATAVKLAPVEEEILGLVTGRHSIAEIIRLVEHDQFTTLGALHTLATAGFIETAESPSADAPTEGGNGKLSAEEATAAKEILDAFNNIFAGIHERVMQVKGDPGRERFRATLKKKSFQSAGVFTGVEFGQDGRLPADVLLHNVADLPDEQRLSRLKGSMDRLLAQQVLQMDRSYPQEDKKAISDLISREKSRISA